MEDVQLSKQVQDINTILSECQRVSATLGSRGWVEIVEPLIDKMIGDVTGSKVEGRWSGGLLDRARKDERREFYVGYKQALIDLHTRIYAYVNNIEIHT